MWDDIKGPFTYSEPVPLPIDSWTVYGRRQYLATPVTDKGCCAKLEKSNPLSILIPLIRELNASYENINRLQRVRPLRQAVITISINLVRDQRGSDMSENDRLFCSLPQQGRN